MPAYGNMNTMGMTQGAASSPMPILSLLGIGGGMLSGLLGRRKTPDAKDLNKKFGVGQLAGDTQLLYKMLASSPMFRSALLGNAATGSRFSNDLSASLQARGLGSTGIGSIAGAAGNQAISAGETALRGGLFQTAQQGALENLLARLQAYTQLQGQALQRPSFGESLGSSLLAAGGSSLF